MTAILTREVVIKLLPTQAAFTSCTDRFPAYIGGYRAGKTFVGCYQAIKHMTSLNPGLTGMMVAPTYDNVYGFVYRKLVELLEQMGIDFTYHDSRHELTLPRYNSMCLLRSADKPDTLKGYTLAWAGIDEVARIHEDIWGVMVSRVSDPDARFLQLWATGTPEGLNWVYERWVENPEPDYRLFEASTDENYHVVRKGYLTGLNSAFDEEQLRAYRYGKFTEGAKGRIYKPFDRRTHLVDKNPFDPNGGAGLVKNLPVFLACDFNVDPCCWVYGQSHQGMVYVAGEIVLKDTDSQEMAAEAWSRLNGYQVTVYGDPAGKSRSTAGKSDYEILRMGGFPRQNVSSAAPAVKDRVNALNRLMRLEKQRDGKERPRLYVHPSCKVLIRDLERVKWKENSGIIDKSDGDLTHASDALGYYVHQEFPLKPPMPGKTKVAEALSRNRRYGRR